MKTLFIALLTLALSTTAAYADRKKHGGGGHKNSSHNSFKKNHGGSNHSFKKNHGGSHHSFKKIHHGSHHSFKKSHNHYGHAYSSYYTSSHPYYYNNYYYSSPWWHSGSYYNHTTPIVADITCAPDTFVKNTTATEAVLVGLTQHELSGAEVFKQKVADLQTMSGQARVEAGMKIIGVKNPNDAKEVLGVVFAREPSAETISRVSDNLNLSQEEARLVVTTTTQALKKK